MIRTSLMVIGAASVTAIAPLARLDSYVAIGLRETPPVVDGVLNDAVWSGDGWNDAFETPQGGVPTQSTAFKVIYDEEHLYIGIRLDDESPTDIPRTPGDRDDTNGDRIATFFDTDLDGSTSYVFVVNAAGVVRDQFGSGSTAWDNGFDTEWESAISVGEDGWSAELKIPFEAMGIEGGDMSGTAWGLQFTRVVERLEETSMWEPFVQSKGWTGSFGRLEFN